MELNSFDYEKLKNNAVKVLTWLFENPEITGSPGYPNEAEDSPEQLLHEEEYWKLETPEERAMVGKTEFLILENEDNSFYEALSQAQFSRGGQEGKLRYELCKYLKHSGNWEKFLPEITVEIQRSQDYRRRELKPKKTLRIFLKEVGKRKRSGSFLELKIASQLYHFSFSILFSKDSQFSWLNFDKPGESRFGREKKVRHYFLVMIHESGSHTWKCLRHYQGQSYVPPGNYKQVFKKTFIVENCCYSKLSQQSAKVEFSTHKGSPLKPWVSEQITTFQTGDDEFYFPQEHFEHPRDLYKLLSTILFGNAFHSEEILLEILEHRERFYYFLNLNPKRRHVHSDSLVNAGKIESFKPSDFSREELEDENLNPVSPSVGSGDIVDLKIAASLYHFCYVVIVMDEKGNLSKTAECRDVGHSHKDQSIKIDFVAFFHKNLRGKSVWFQLDHFYNHNKVKNVNASIGLSLNRVEMDRKFKDNQAKTMKSFEAPSKEVADSYSKNQLQIKPTDIFYRAHPQDGQSNRVMLKEVRFNSLFESSSPVSANAAINFSSAIN